MTAVAALSTVTDGPERTLHGERFLEDRYPGYVPALALSPEPAHLSQSTFDAMLQHAFRIKASEVSFQTDNPIYMEVEGRLCRVSKRTITQVEMQTIVNTVYAGGVARLNSGQPVNKEYPVALSTDLASSRVQAPVVNFRFNAASCLARGENNGIAISMRVIPPEPPRLEALGLEPELLKHLFPESGLVLIVGPTGSGKTTILGGIVRALLENPNVHKKMSLFDSPPEFLFHSVPRAAAMLSQHDIPRNYQTWAEAIRDSLRRMTRILVVGESRERETIEAAIEGAKTGQTVYTTGHVESVPLAVSRFANLFQPDERMIKVYEMVGLIKVAVVQRLVPRIDGMGRVALREFLVFDQEVRDRVRAAQSLVEVETILKALVEERGQSMLASANKALEAGFVSAEFVRQLEFETKATLSDRLGMVGGLGLDDTFSPRKF